MIDLIKQWLPEVLMAGAVLCMVAAVVWKRRK
jgi:hypothetical protein